MLPKRLTKFCIDLLLLTSIFNVPLVHCHKEHHHHSDHAHQHQPKETDHFLTHIIGDELKQDDGDIRPCKFEEPDDVTKEKIEKDMKIYRTKFHKEDFQQLRSSVIEIDVYFHVFTLPSGEGAIPEETVRKQISVLNDAFSGEPSSYEECEGFTYGQQHATPFRFVLKYFETIEDSSAYFLDEPDSDTIRSNLRKGDCSALNIFTGFSSFLGWAYFPINCPSEDGPTNVLNRLDSVVLYYKTLPEMELNNYDEGDTATHEVGHWLGLYHTFRSTGCDNEGDLVGDTPAQNDASFQCPINRDSCPGDPGFDPIHNYMDYTYDCCMYQFTEGQIDRMILQGEMYRGLRDSSPTSSPFPSVTPTYFPSSNPTELRNPSSNPTLLLLPSNGSECCPSGQFKFVLKIKTDIYPNEITWKITSSTTRVVVESGGPYQNKSETYETTMCLENGCYIFLIQDSFGDGICCNVGNGFYEGYLNGNLIYEFQGGDYTFSDERSFCAEDSCNDGLVPSTAPTLSPQRSALPSSIPSRPKPSPFPSTVPSDDIWAIESTTVRHDRGEEQNSIFVSHNINSGPRGAELVIYHFDCTHEVGVNDLVLIGSGPTIVPRKRILYDFDFDESKMGISKLVLFDEFSVTAGMISFCTKVTTKSRSNVKVTSKKLKFKIRFNWSPNQLSFDAVDIDEEPTKIEEDDFKQIFSATVCQCSVDYQCVDQSNPIVLSQGETAPTLHVCITTASNIVRMSNLEFRLENDKGFRYFPVKLGDEAPNTDDMTSLSEFESTVMISHKVIDELLDGSSVSANGQVFFELVDSNKYEETLDFQLNFQVEGVKSIAPTSVPIVCRLQQLFRRILLLKKK